MEHNVDLKVSVTTDDIVNLLSMEGGGFDYWAELGFDDTAYAEARKQINKAEDDICCEDVMAQILESGGKLSVYDREEGESYDLTLEKLLDGFKGYAAQGFREGIDGMEDMDAMAADEILQIAIFGELTYS